MDGMTCGQRDFCWLPPQERLAELRAELREHQSMQEAAAEEQHSLLDELQHVQVGGVTG